MNEHEPSLVLRDEFDIEIAYLATVITGKAPNAKPFLEMVVALLPHDESGVRVHGTEAAVLKGEIIDSLDSLRDHVDDYSHLVFAAHGLLITLRGDSGP